MANILTNIFCFLGVYYFVASIWQIAEKLQYGEITVKNEDTAIACAIAFAVTVLLGVSR